MRMKLWLFYPPGTNKQVEEACRVATETLLSRGVSVSEAFTATLEANELDESHSEEVTPNAPAVAAWYAAEFAALSRLSELTGEWPAQTSLIIIEEE